MTNNHEYKLHYLALTPEEAAIYEGAVEEVGGVSIYRAHEDTSYYDGIVAVNTPDNVAGGAATHKYGVSAKPDDFRILTDYVALMREIDQ